MGKHDRTLRQDNGAWLALYTGLYLCGALTLCAILLRYHRVLIWNLDGIRQHYTVLGYLRNMVRAALSGERVPMMRFSLGQGMDLLTTCTYYGYTDPLCMLAALAGESTLEWAYVGIALLRNYLAGLFFALYARQVGAKDPRAVAWSSAIYVFGGFFLRMVGQHPYFINGALYLPLLLLAIERVLNGRRWLMYALVVALMMIVNFYFAYINTVVAVLYIVVRLIARLGERGVARSAGDGLLLLGAYLLGLALSAAVFLPVVMVFFGNSREGVDAGYSASMLHYSTKLYRKMFESAFLPVRSVSKYTYLNYLPLALFGLMGLFTVRGGRARQIRVALYLCAVTACVPLLGKVMNGMAYPTNRWIYAMNLFVALGCCFGLPRLFREGAAGRVIAVLGALYAVAMSAWLVLARRYAYLICTLVMLAMAVMIFMATRDGRPRRDRLRAKRWMTGILAVAVAVYTAMVYLPRGANFISKQEKWNVRPRIESNAKAHLIEDEGVYRVAQSACDDPNSLLLDYMGPSFYWSLIDGGLSDYYQELWTPSLITTYHLYGLYGNTRMNAVAAVKYFVEGENDRYLAPYGFDREAASLKLPNGAAATVYRNQYALPLGYAYDMRMARDTYDALPVEEKLQALTAYAIVDGSPEGVPAADVSALAGNARELPFTLTPGEGVEWTEGAISARPGATARLSFDAPEDHEVFVLFEKMTIENASKGKVGQIVFRSEGGDCDLLLRGEGDNFYYPRKGSAVCVGSRATDGCDVLFNAVADVRYAYDSMRVVAIPLESYREDMRKRMGEAMRDVSLSADSLSGRISVSGDRVLQIAVPYCAGWRAWVDGVEQPVFRCGGMYMGLALGAGDHEIEMRYVTPGLKAGAAVSGAALILTVILAALSAAKRKRERKAEA